MEQIRIAKDSSSPVLEESFTLYFDNETESRAYLKTLRKVWPRTRAEERSINFKRG